MHPPTKPARHLRAIDGREVETPTGDEPTPAVADALAALVRRAQGGDDEAWTTLYRRTYNGLYRHVGYLVQDPVVAEDLAQESFARALCRLDRFDGRSCFETWLHGIGVNVVRTHWRGSGRRDRAHDRLARHLASETRPRADDPELSHVRKQRAAALLGVVRELPPKLREAYVLLELREVPREQAAEQLGITAANLSVRASRARAKVREELCKLGWIVEESS